MKIKNFFVPFLVVTLFFSISAHAEVKKIRQNSGKLRHSQAQHGRAQKPIKARKTSTKPQSVVKTDLNNADAKTIATSVKGIGKKKAEALVAYRTEHGKFKRLDDLLLIKGFSRGIIDKIRPQVVV